MNVTFEKIADTYMMLVQKYPNTSLDSLLNVFMKSLSEEDIEQIDGYYLLLKKIGETFRNAPESIKNELIEICNLNET